MENFSFFIYSLEQFKLHRNSLRCEINHKQADLLPVPMMQLIFIQQKQAHSFKENTKFIYPFTGDILSSSSWITLSYWILYLNYWDTLRCKIKL